MTLHFGRIEKSLYMNFRQYLENEYLKWQQQEGRRRTVNEFAEYLGVGQSTLSMWWNDERKPQGDNIRKLADKLGLEVYDVLGLKRPDAMLHYINKVWDTLPKEIQQALLEKAEGYVVKNEKDVPNAKRKSSKTSKI